MSYKASAREIRFHFQQKGLAIKNRHRLKTFIFSIFRKEKTPFNSLQYIFCSDNYLLEINQQYLQHDYYTDIITFNLASKKAPVKGEIYISLERVRDNAHSLDQYIYLELHRVIFHGVLHLCGYKDKTSRDILLMRKKEDFYLDQYFK